jgi:hypothetical protein
MSIENFEFCQLTEFAERVGRHHTTLNNWFNDLEAQRIHYVSRTTTGKERVFDKVDYDLAMFIKEKRDQKWAMPSIFELLQESDSKITLRPFPEDFEGDESPSMIVLAEQMRTKIADEMKIVLEQTLDRFKADFLRDQQLTLPNPTQQREREVNMRLTERRIDAQLKERAIQEWNKLPESERTRKRGLFGKEEDYIKREDFIRKYVSDHEEEAFRNEFGI